MNYWKLGCRWGSKSEGLPLFFDLLLQRGIVISWVDKDFGNNSFVLLTDGFTPIGIAKTRSARRPIQELEVIEGEFNEREIYFDQNLFYYQADVFPIEHPDFTFDYQKGISQIHQQSTKNHIRLAYSNALKKLEMETAAELLIRKNQIILQGPPGTGKTRLAMQLAKALTGISDEADLISSEQVQLVQFHPSYSYEDFVEGLKPHAANNSVVFRTEDGIFKTFCKRALVSTLSNNESTSNENSFDYIFSQYIDTLRSNLDQIFLSKNNVELVIDSLSDTSITVKYKYSNSEKKAPGTRPFIVSKDKLRIVAEENIDPAKVKNLRKEIKPLVGHIAGALFAVYTHFYEFMQSLTIDVDDLQSEDYDFQSALDEFKELNAKGEANFDKKYILIIDEMNRANLSTVLGELISLMEDGKRLGAAEELALELPYSKERFGIPKNVYIIGTMNTADRSVSQIDYAIRRRFAFIDVLPQDLAHEGSIEFDSNLFLAVSRLFQDENGKESLYLSPEFKAKEVQLGHSYFIKKEGGMKMRLEYEIKPILFEYIRDGILKETAHSEIESLTCSE